MPGRIRSELWARTATWARSHNLSFDRIRPTWDFTVASETSNRRLSTIHPQERSTEPVHLRAVGVRGRALPQLVLGPVDRHLG